MARLRFGILGCGVIGKVHAAAIDATEDAELVAVADDVPQTAESLAARFEVAPYSSLDAMLARADLDVVNVCTPSGMHGEHACAVMRSGRHVVVEKPMEIRREAIDEMLHVQDKTGAKLAVIFGSRFNPVVRTVRTLVRDGAFGTLALGNAHLLWWRSQDYYDSGGWRGTWALDGGGALMNQAIHSIDLLQWLVGPVRSVQAYMDTRAHTIETEDVAVAAIRFENGALGTIAATTAAYPGVTNRIEIFGTRGSAIIENDRLAYLHVAKEGEAEAPAYGLPPSTDSPAPTGAAANPAAVGSGGHKAQIEDMVQAIHEDRAPLVDGHEGRRAVDIILAIYDSARTGREVELP